MHEETDRKLDSIHIMVVDNEKLVVQSIVNLLEVKGYSIHPFLNAIEAMSVLVHGSIPVDIIVTDINMPNVNGYTFIERIRAANLVDVKILVLTGYGSIESAVKAIKLGADGYFEKDKEPALLLFEVKKIVDEIFLRRRLHALEQQVQSKNFYLFDSHNKTVQNIYQMAERVAPKDVNILIMGESGTGKEILARFIHQHSIRKNKKFLSVNCSAIPDSLFESSMFGHVKGSFTGADSDCDGYFVQASGGTLMLDEIGELSVNNQAKLLKAIEEMTFFPVGSSKSVTVDCRLISATNKNLQEQIEEKGFRSDLFYRINTVTFELLPLRKRKEDILDFVTLYLNFFSQKYQTFDYSFDQEALDTLIGYNWPGNIRELKQVVERCIIFANDKIIDKKTLLAHGFGEKSFSLTKVNNFKRCYRDYKYDSDRLYFQSLLQMCENNINEVSRVSEMNRTYIYRKFQELGIDIT